MGYAGSALQPFLQGASVLSERASGRRTEFFPGIFLWNASSGFDAPDTESGGRGAEKEFYIAFLCEGVLGELVYWLREGSKITPEEFVEDLHDISLGLARKIIAEEAGTQNEIPLFQNKKV